MNFVNGQLIYLIILACVLGAFLFRFFRFGGFKAAMFGAPIVRTVGEVSGAGSKLMSVAVKIHTLGGGSERSVGLEFVAKSVASYQMTPVSLSASEAKKLIALLQVATAGNSAER